MIELDWESDAFECECCGYYYAYKGELTIGEEKVSLYHDEHLNPDSSFGYHSSPIPLASALLLHINPVFSFFNGKKLSFKEISELIKNKDASYYVETGYLPRNINKLVKSVIKNPSNKGAVSKFFEAQKDFLFQFDLQPTNDLGEWLLNIFYRIELSSKLSYPKQKREMGESLTRYFNADFYKPNYDINFDLNSIFSAFSFEENESVLEDYRDFFPDDLKTEIEVILQEGEAEIPFNNQIVKIPTLSIEFKSDIGLDKIAKLALFPYL